MGCVVGRIFSHPWEKTKVEPLIQLLLVHFSTVIKQVFF